MNDIDSLRIKFYTNMKDEIKLNEFYKLQDEVIKNGQEYYYDVLGQNKYLMNTDIMHMLHKKTIHAFRCGLWPTTTKINKKIISHNWITYFNNSIITNKDYKIIIDKYKDNEHTFLYLDPPYMISFNECYS